MCGRPLEDGQWLLSQLSPLKPLREDDRQRKRGGRARRTTAVWDKWASVDKLQKGMFMWSCSQTSDKSSHIRKPLSVFYRLLILVKIGIIS